MVLTIYISAMIDNKDDFSRCWDWGSFSDLAGVLNDNHENPGIFNVLLYL